MSSTDPTLAELQAVSLAAWRGAIALDNTAKADWGAAVVAGLVDMHYPSMGDGWPERTSTGTRYLAALQRVLDGLSDEHIRHIRGAHPLFSAVADGLVRRGLATVHVREKFEMEPTPLGAALLLLRERGGEG